MGWRGETIGTSSEAPDQSRPLSVPRSSRLSTCEITPRVSLALIVVSSWNAWRPGKLYSHRTLLVMTTTSISQRQTSRTRIRPGEGTKPGVGPGNTRERRRTRSVAAVHLNAVGDVEFTLAR